MKILIATQEYGKSYTSLSVSYYKAFKSLTNIQVDLFNYRGFSRIEVLNKITRNIGIINNNHLKRENERLVNYVLKSKPDVLFFIKGTYFFPETIKEIKFNNTDIILTCFDPDDPYNMASSNEFILNSIKYYDIYFIWSHNLVKKIKNDFNVHSIYLPFAADRSTIYLTDIQKFNSDITFIGNGDRKRSDFFKSLDDLLNSKDMNINIYGNYWGSYKNINVFGQKDGDELLNTLSTSKIILNILREQNINSNNMRTFEIPAAGGFMLHEYSEEAMDFFRPGIEADYFASPEECFDKIQYYLNNDSIRERISIAGYKKIFEGRHTYTERAKHIIETIEKI